jgi:serine/threonine protein kinase/Tol biopolymer transport system component
MGEVYRARDTRLGRDIAIKVLPAHLSADSNLKARFEREAKAISALNHPNICTLHDVGSQDGTGYLVMEFIEGQSLAERLQKGSLPTDQILKIGREIADALDKAHRNGIIHRDLKPGNVMLTKSGAKLLDFGLARSASSAASLATLTAVTAPQHSPITQEGTIVGTFQYMSPEQIEGKEIDGRSDIFSLGAVLYEMLTGQRAFPGKSQLSVASAILEKEPEPIASLKPLTPPSLEHTIRRCLAKNQDDRWQSAADVKHELDWVSQSSATGAAAIPGTSKGTGHKSLLLLSVALAIALILAAIIASNYRRANLQLSAPVVRATLPAPPGITVLTLSDQAGAPAVSHDGTSIVFAGLHDGRQMLFVRPLDGSATKPLPGTEGGKFPFWSPDGKSIGFFADQQLKRLDLAGGPPLSLAPAGDGRGGSWADDTIIFTPYIYEAIYRVPASGSGKPVTVSKIDTSLHTTHRWPSFLPDGKHFLYLAANHVSGKEANSAVYVGSIEGGDAKPAVHTNGSAFYSSGNLFYYRDGSLLAQPFDLDHLELKGDAKPIGNVLRESGNWGVIASGSDNGVLLFQSAGDAKFPVVWFDRGGRTIGAVSIAGQQLQDIRLSPDRTRVAYDAFDGPIGCLYVSDLKTGARTRLTYQTSAWYTAWSPDSTKLVYSAQPTGAENTELVVVRADGSGPREKLLSSGKVDHPSDWSRDGKYIVFDRGMIGSQSIWLLPLFGDRTPVPLFRNANYDHGNGRVSPDGKWIAYFSAESGRSEIYITSFPAGAGRWQISNNGIIPSAVWRADGKELYFSGLDGNLMAATIQPSSTSVGLEKVQVLFRSPFLTGVVHDIYDVDPKDGQRFIGAAAPDTSGLSLNIITNWTAAPAPK